jgi:hypothetical protein
MKIGNSWLIGFVVKQERRDLILKRKKFDSGFRCRKLKLVLGCERGVSIKEQRIWDEKTRAQENTYVH